MSTQPKEPTPREKGEAITAISRFKNGWLVATANSHILMDNCTVEEAISALREKVPTPTQQKTYCGKDHCTGMWNLPCEDPNHPQSFTCPSCGQTKYSHQPSEGWEKEYDEKYKWGGEDFGVKIWDYEEMKSFIRTLLATARQEERKKIMKEVGRYLEHTTHCDVYRADLSDYEGKVDCNCGLDKLLTQNKG